MKTSFSILWIGIHFYFLSKYSFVQCQSSKEICVENQMQTISSRQFKVCYSKEIENRSVLVWFTIAKSLNDTFDTYRYVLRPIDYLFSSTVIIETLTNFTELVDTKNSLHMMNLEAGEYEVCVEFQLHLLSFIYQPRDGCILINIGPDTHETFKGRSKPILIALASGNVIFFILGLIVQSVKKKRRKQIENDVQSRRERSASTIGTFFRRYIDQPRPSYMHQWALNRAFRHRIDTQEHDFERLKPFRRLSRLLFPSSQPRSRSETISHDRILSSEASLTMNNISTISGHESYLNSGRKISFHLSPPEEF